MRAQLILYDQCNQAYCDPSAEGIFFICSTGTPHSPIGPLYFHPSSRITEYAIGKHFCDEQRSKGKKSDMIIARSYLEGMLKLSHIYQITEWLVMTPSEQYIHTKMIHIQQKLASSGIRLIFLPNTQFLLSQEEFAKHYEKPPIMEFFYRMMRKKYNILMDGDKPV
jgi:deoxyribodipyrimidine photolyase-related protein